MPRLLHHPTPGAWFDIGMEEWSLALCAFHPRETNDGFYITGQTAERIRFGTEIRRIVEWCDSSGYLFAFLDGLRWEQVRKECRRKVCCGHCARALAADLEAFREALEDRGMRCEG